MTKNENLGSNYGIVGNVNAEALAVGQGARAVKNVHGAANPELLQSLAALRDAVATLPLPAATHAAVAEHLGELESVAKKPEPEREEVGGLLTKIGRKLKESGVVLTEGLAVWESLKKVAVIAGFSLKALGF